MAKLERDVKNQSKRNVIFINMLSKTKLFLSAISAVFLFGCSEENNTFTSDATGKISFSLATDLQVSASVTTGRAAADPDDERLSALKNLKSEDFAITLDHATPGIYTGKWNSISDFPAEETFPIGNYTMTASYGSENSEGFDAPWVYGETTFTVKENATTSANISAKVANSLVHVTFTDNFKNYFTAFNAGVRSTKGTLHYVGPEENRPVYVTPGNIDVTADVTMPSGKTASLTMGSFTAKVGTLHSVKLDTQYSNETVTLVVTFNDDMTETIVEIDLSEELEDAPAPVVTTDGFEGGATVQFVEGNGQDSDNAYKYHIAARGGMQEVILTVTSPSGQETQYDIANESVRSQLTQNGARFVGVEQGAIFGLVDLTSWFGNLKLSNGSAETTKFKIAVKDAFGKTLADNSENKEDNSISVIVNPETLKLEEYSEMTSETFVLKVTSNMDAVQGRVTLYADNDYGNSIETWDNVSYTVENVDKDSSVPPVYTYTLKANTPASVLTFNLWGVSQKPIDSNKLSVTRPLPEIELVFDERDIFATHALVSLKAKDDKEKFLLDNILRKKQYSPSIKVDEITATATDDIYTFSLTGLEPNKTLTAEATLGTDSEGVLKAVTANGEFTTEEAKQLENGNMENWSSERKTKGAFKCDLYSVEGWATLNNYTTAYLSAGTDYSGLSSTLSTTDSHSGNAALVRSVGFDFGGSTAGINNANKFSQGELFLGSFEGTGKDGANYGIDFSSRPSSLSFWYKYTPTNSNDKGYAEITVKNSVGETLSSNTVSLSSTGSYQQINMSLSYGQKADKASILQVIFKSTDAGDTYLNSKDIPKKTDFWGILNDYYVGSQLYIDDIVLNY